jgi:hypothetical protein
VVKLTLILAVMDAAVNLISSFNVNRLGLKFVWVDESRVRRKDIYLLSEIVQVLR